MNRQRGFGMLEILITMVVIAVGMLGIAALQARAQQAEVESYQRTQALILMNDMANRLLANRSAAPCYVIAGFVGSGEDAPLCTAFAAGERRDRADADLAEWVDALDGTSEQINDAAVGSIAGARGCITANAALTEFTISVAWQGMNTISAAENDCASGQYGEDETRRRVVSRTVRLADLVAN